MCVCVCVVVVVVVVVVMSRADTEGVCNPLAVVSQATSVDDKKAAFSNRSKSDLTSLCSGFNLLCF